MERLEYRDIPSIPRLIFLDTNVVQNLETFGELIYDNALLSPFDSKLSKLSSRIRTDIFALVDLMALGRRIGLPIAISSRTLKELEITRRPAKKSDLISWGEDLAGYFSTLVDESEDAIEDSYANKMCHFTFNQRCWLSDQLEDLPQDSDRQLVIDAIEYGCDVFLTMDYKTIWRHREMVSKFGLRVIRPVEFLDSICP